MSGPARPYAVIDVHIHAHPGMAATLLSEMEASGLERVVNLGILERLGLPFAEGMRAFRIPTLVVCFFCQRWIVRGLAMSGIKG